MTSNESTVEKTNQTISSNESVSFMNTLSNLASKSPFNKDQKNELDEPKSIFYEDRIKILFERVDINNENYLFRFLKKSQEKVKQKHNYCNKAGFFIKRQSDEFNLAVTLKENISNYSLIFSIYFQRKERLKSLKLFLLMCENNTNYIDYLTKKIVEQLPRINNRNQIAKYYPTITKIMLQILAVFIKLSGRFNKSQYEIAFIKMYYKIIHILSKTVIKTLPKHAEELNNQLKNERRYFYASCIFDSAIYLFNRFLPLSIPINLLLHILDYYKNQLTFVPNEIESVLLLKVNYNLGLFYYISGDDKESINNFNQAKESLFDMTFFPESYFKKTENESEKSVCKFNINNNSTNNIFNFNEFFSEYHNMENMKKNCTRGSLSSCTFVLNNRSSIDKETLINKLKERVLKRNEEEGIVDYNKMKFCTIYLGAQSLLNDENPILVEQAKEKLLIEIELILSEIELKHKNYKESLNHIKSILAMQSNDIDDYIENAKKNYTISLRGSSLISKTRSLFHKKNDSLHSSNGINNKFKKNENQFHSDKSKTIESDMTWNFRIRKNENNNQNSRFINNNIRRSSNKRKKFNYMKYMLSISDQYRMMCILEHIESANNTNNHLSSTNKIRARLSLNQKKKNESLKKDRKILTSKEMEKFFVFICSLSVYQLKVLNDTQPEPSQRRNDLPIIFSNQFQDCLTNAQRMSLFALETMSLSRYMVLKDTNKDIDPENFDYRFMKYRIKETDSDEEYLNKIKKKNNIIKLEKKRKSSHDSNLSVISQNNNNYGLQNEKDSLFFDLLLNNIKTKKNKKFIDSHRNSISKFLNQMNKEELTAFIRSPKLLKKMIDGISKDNINEENGGDINNFSAIPKKIKNGEDSV